MQPQVATDVGIGHGKYGGFHPVQGHIIVEPVGTRIHQLTLVVAQATDQTSAPDPAVAEIQPRCFHSIHPDPAGHLDMVQNNGPFCSGTVNIQVSFDHCSPSCQTLGAEPQVVQLHTTCLGLHVTHIQSCRLNPSHTNPPRDIHTLQHDGPFYNGVLNIQPPFYLCTPSCQTLGPELNPTQLYATCPRLHIAQVQPSRLRH